MDEWNGLVVGWSTPEDARRLLGVPRKDSLGKLKIRKVKDGSGDNSVVWVPEDVQLPAPGEDVSYDVTVSNVMIRGVPRTCAYRVTLFDPEDNQSKRADKNLGQVMVRD
jgi:hypothetical protein